MTDEWYEVHYLNFDKVIVSGQYTSAHENIEMELNHHQKEALFDFNYKQEQARKLFMRKLLEL